ncbi:MAG: Helix-turn-helix protein [Amycolatopsis sp.]|jgi:transcriptional regulator with XRE-family HTH domain|uniref:helix-turn-helix domain-containing protein n=1 Tax=Amycolatopsis sp. TaxID=37632 RepID=UPI00261F2A31|nr:helix-turn-helix transcriptional regulator [Amycolatopsis sp.]MCU1683852.1 Helix-turn-helix protein [Amycolatopsis sp.]
MGEPNLPARQLGRALRRLREQVGLTQDEAGNSLRFSKSKMSRIEGGYLPDYHGFRALLDRYGLIVSDWDEYIAAYDRAKQRGWWFHYGVDNRGFLPIEAEASLVREFQFGYVPGLLQTEAYMREVFTSDRRPLAGQKLENAVAVRLRRQRRLVEEPILRLHVIVDEGALCRAVLTGEAHQEQLRHLVNQSSLQNVTIQVVAESIGAYPGQFGNLIVASFPDDEEPDVAYVEHVFGSVHVEKEAEVSAARMAFKDLADRALDQADSIALIERL